MKKHKIVHYGILTEESTFNTPAYHLSKRGKRTRGNSTPGQRARNKRGRIKKLARLICINFHRSGLFVTLTFADGSLPATWEEHDAVMKKFTRKLSGVAKKGGKPAPNWIYVCSDYNPYKGENVRRHTHLIIVKEGFSFKDGRWFYLGEDFSNIWPHGEIHVVNLGPGPDYSALAKYLIDQARSDKPNAAAYHASRGLGKPFEKTEDVGPFFKVKPPTGAVILDSYKTYYGVEHFKYFMPGGE